MKRTTYLLSGIMALLASCSNDEHTLIDDHSSRTPITLTARLDGMTRAAHGLQGSTFVVDRVGVSIAKSDGTYLAENKEFTIDKTNGSLTATAGEKYYFPTDGTTLSVFAYAPYNASSMPTIFEIKTDQTADADYLASDVLYGLPTGNGTDPVNPIQKSNGSNVKLQFTHQCAKIVVSITPGDGFTESDFEGCVLKTGEVYTSMELSNAASGTFNSFTSSTYSKSAITFGTYTSSDTNGNPTYDANGTLTSAAVLIPQDIPAGTNFLTLNFPATSTATPLVLTLPAALTLEAGKEYHFNLTANRSALTLKGDMAIKDWGSVDKGSSDLSEAMLINLSNLTSDLTVTSDCYLTGTTSQKITIAEGVTLTLKNAIIEGNQIVCEGNAKIYLKGENRVTSTTNYEPGIKAGPAGTTLTIDGDADGTIKVQGGDRGAGIGSGSNTCGNITISGGNVIATGGFFAAGIGGGFFGSCGHITIDMTDKTDYSIKVKSGYSGNCIGLGDEYGSTTNFGITIKNSTITLELDDYGTYFPTRLDILPTFEGTVVIKDKNGNDITSTIDHN